jgi:outer membrane protein assembly factor BamE (lipoprotein component of BamABCDE complex)
MKSTALYLSTAAVAIFLAACSSAVTANKLQQIGNGMKTDQVTALLGQPTRIEQSEITGLTGEVYHYVSTRGDARVVLLNGTVFATTFDATGGHS